MSAHELRLFFLLQRTAHRLKVQADATLKEAAGLTSAQAGALSIIAGNGPISQKSLAQLLGQRESAMTNMAARLAKAGYITKVTSAQDGRAFELAITKTGRSALAKVKRAFAEVNQLMDKHIAEPDMARMHDNLHHLLAALDSHEGSDA